MSIKRFIDRPLLSIVINVMVVAVGIISLPRLPIEKFPDIAPPTVYLRASYPGASAAAVQKLSTYFLGKIRIHMTAAPDEEIIINRDKVATVKRWLDS